MFCASLLAVLPSLDAVFYTGRTPWDCGLWLLCHCGCAGLGGRTKMHGCQWPVELHLCQHRGRVSDCALEGCTFFPTSCVQRWTRQTKKASTAHSPILLAGLFSLTWGQLRQWVSEDGFQVSDLEKLSNGVTGSVLLMTRKGTSTIAPILQSSFMEAQGDQVTYPKSHWQDVTVGIWTQAA